MPKRFVRQRKKYKPKPFQGERQFVGSCLSGDKYARTSDFDRSKPEVYGKARIALTNANDKQSAQFEVYGVVQSCVGSICFINGLKFYVSDLIGFGYNVKAGVLISVAAERNKRNPSLMKVISRFESNLRSLSDMRSKPAWRKLPWLEPAIDAIYAERDRLTRETGIEHHVDHIHPVNSARLCGLTVPWNLQVIPAVENLRKSNKLIAS